MSSTAGLSTSRLSSGEGCPRMNLGLKVREGWKADTPKFSKGRLSALTPKAPVAEICRRASAA